MLHPCAYALQRLLQSALAAAHGEYDIYLHLDDAGTRLRALEIRLKRNDSSLPTAARMGATTQVQPLSRPRVYIAPVEDAAVVPLVVAGRGAPFAGQREVSDRDVLIASSDLPPAERAALEQQLNEDGGANAKAPQSFFQQYWHLIVPALVVYVLLSGGGGNGVAAGANDRAPVRRE